MPLLPSISGQVDQVCGANGDDVLGTIFPMPAGQGSSWNRSAVRAVAAAIAAESRASGADRGFSPEYVALTLPTPSVCVCVCVCVCTAVHHEGARGR